MTWKLTTCLKNTSVQLQEADASQISSVLEEKKTSFHE